MILGLTGGIASGKSTVSSLLVSLGAKLVDADQIAREVVLPGSPVLDMIISKFGQAILTTEGTLDRKKLGEIVFGDQQLRKQLEQIMHPAIRSIMNGRIQQYELANPNGLVVVDIPLLYESKMEKMYEEVMLVYIPPDLQIERLMLRDQLTRDQANEQQCKHSLFTKKRK